QEAELSLQAPDEAARALTPADLAAVADHLESVIAEADPRKAKALLRVLIDERRVNGRAEILPTYRLVTPEVCAMSEKVGREGIEPSTLGLRVRSGGAPLTRMATRKPAVCGKVLFTNGYS